MYLQLVLVTTKVLSPYAVEFEVPYEQKRTNKDVVVMKEYLSLRSYLLCHNWVIYVCSGR